MTNAGLVVKLTETDLLVIIFRRVINTRNIAVVPRVCITPIEDQRPRASRIGADRYDHPVQGNITGIGWVLNLIIHQTANPRLAAQIDQDTTTTADFNVGTIPWTDIYPRG